VHDNMGGGYKSLYSSSGTPMNGCEEADWQGS